jgi:hypothetical protein
MPATLRANTHPGIMRTRPGSGVRAALPIGDAVSGKSTPQVISRVDEAVTVPPAGRRYKIVVPSVTSKKGDLVALTAEVVN